jgi:hypothetical protein
VPEQELVDRLRGYASRGTFEAHVTVQAPDLASRERFRAACAELGVKSVLIELPQGVTPAQPMTSSYHRGDLDAVTAEVAGIARHLRREGFAVTRVKLEALVSNAGVPETDEEAARLPAANYFEFHVKVMLPPQADLKALRARCAAHNAHLSANAFKAEADGRPQRFVTLRLYGVGRARATGRFEALLRELAGDGYRLSNKLREYTLFDSNVALDAGWIDAPRRAGGPA